MKVLLESDIRLAMSRTKSNAEAARFLGVNNRTYRRYARMYIDLDTEKSLYDMHMNRGGKNTQKFSLNYMRKEHNIEDIIAGKYPKFPLQRFKEKLIRDGIIEEKCELCGFFEKRITDLKAPLLLTFRDGNNKNWQLDNLELLCFNCYYLTIGNLFGRKYFPEVF